MDLKASPETTAPAEVPRPPKMSYNDLYLSLGAAEPPKNETLISQLATVFESLVIENEPKAPIKSIFAAKQKPSISLKDYFTRLAKYSRCSAESLLIAVVYVDRFNERTENHFVTATNAHKFVKKAVLGRFYVGLQVQ